MTIHESGRNTRPGSVAAHGGSVTTHEAGRTTRLDSVAAHGAGWTAHEGSALSTEEGRPARPGSVSASPASLELRKIYQRLPDSRAEQDGLIRVIDESGEDYLYAQESFVPIAVPEAVEKVFRGAA